MRDDFAVFILTHGRAGNVSTVRALERAGYTGKLFYILDNEDPQIEEYKAQYGEEKIIIFDKEAIMDKVDTLDNFKKKAAILYARYACIDIAKNLGLKYFTQYDDDYTRFSYRYIDPITGEFVARGIKQMDKLLSVMVDYMEQTDALTIAMCQGGDFIGGKEGNNWKKGLMRKAMNTFICRTDKPIDFRGTLNDDVTMYTTLGSRGELIMSLTCLAITQQQSQSLEGGMTDAYKEGGTYLKSFYSIIPQPSSIKISYINTTHGRIHHRISWNNTVPRILDEKYKKVKNPTEEDFNARTREPQPEHFRA